MNFDDELQRMMEPSRLWMGSITQAPAQAEAPQGADLGSLEQALVQLFAGQQKGPTAENGYFIPEFEGSPAAGDVIQAPEPSPAAANFPNQQARANRLSANWNKQGFTFEVDPVTGTTTITNTEATRAKYGAGGMALTTPSKTELNAPANFRAQMQAIQGEKDPVQRAAMFADMQAQASVFKANIYQNVMQQAEAKLNIPGLEAALAQNEAADKADPRWQEFQSDSKMTAQIRQQILRARAQADNEAKQMLMGNTSIASMDAQLKTADALFRRMENLQARAEAKADASEDRKNATQENILFRQQLEDQELVQATSPELLQRVQIIDPSLKGKSSVELARYIHKGVKDKETQVALTAQVEELPDLAVLGKNASALKLLAAKEAELTGKDPATVTTELKTLREGMFNDKLLQQQLRTLYAGQPEALKQVQMQLAQSAALGSTKQDQTQAEALRWQIVQGAAKQKVAENFLGDASTWGMVDPDFTKAVEQARATKGGASAADVLAAYVGSSVGQERQLKQQRFFTLFNLAVEPKTKSLIAPLNAEFVKQHLIAQMNKKTVMEKLSEGTDAIITGTLGNAIGMGSMPLMLDFFGVKSDGQ